MNAKMTIFPEFGIMRVAMVYQFKAIADLYSDTAITLSKENASASPMQVLSVLCMALRSGDQIEVRAEGPRAAEAIEAVHYFFTHRSADDLWAQEAC